LILKKTSITLCAILFALLVSIPSTFAGKMTRDPGFEAVDAYVEGQMARWNLPGMALAIVQDGEVVYLQGYGKAGPDGRPMTAQTPLYIASLSKSFTALAVMQLVEAGVIDLDEPAKTYLPWFRVADEAASARITVRQLLNQNSGLPEASGREVMFSKDQSDRAIENAVRELADDELLDPAGYEYSNGNYLVLGAIVQAVSGQPFHEYVQAKILDPLEMSNCYTSREEAEQNGLSDGYGRWWFGIPLPRTPPYSRAGLPTGMLICDAEGLGHYLAAYLNGGRHGGATILSPQGVAQMHSPAVPTSHDEGYYGMGWIVGPVNGGAADYRSSDAVYHSGDAVYHSGDAPNHQAALLMVPEEKLGIALLTNTNNITILYITRTMAAGVMSILHGEQPAGFKQDSFIRMIYWTVLGPFALALLWAGWSIPRVLTRRRRDVPSPRGLTHVLWALVLPLLLDGFFIFYYLILTPILWNFTIKGFAIMYPNVWSVMVVGALLGIAGIVVRLVAVLGPRKQM